MDSQQFIEINNEATLLDIMVNDNYAFSEFDHTLYYNAMYPMMIFAHEKLSKEAFEKCVFSWVQTKTTNHRWKKKIKIQSFVRRHQFRENMKEIEYGVGHVEQYQIKEVEKLSEQEEELALLEGMADLANFAKTKKQLLADIEKREKQDYDIEKNRLLRKQNAMFNRFLRTLRYIDMVTRATGPQDRYEMCIQQ